MGLFSKLFGKGDPEPARDPAAEQAAKQARIDALEAQKQQAALERAAKPAPPPKEFVKRRCPVSPSRARIRPAIPPDQLPTWEKVGLKTPELGIDVVFANPLSINLDELREELQFLFVDALEHTELMQDAVGISGKIQWSFGALHVTTSQMAYGDEVIQSIQRQVPWEAIVASRQRGPKGEPSGYEVTARKEILKNLEARERLLAHPYRCKLVFSGSMEDELRVFDAIYVWARRSGKGQSRNLAASISMHVHLSIKVRCRHS